MLMVITFRISTVFIVTERQFVVLVFAIFYCFVPLGILHFPLGAVARYLSVGCLYVVLLIVNTVLAIWIARQYDHGVELRESDSREADSIE